MKLGISTCSECGGHVKWLGDRWEPHYCPHILERQTLEVLKSIEKVLEKIASQMWKIS